MSTNNIMGLLGGLALFLYGMQMMSTGLEAAAGNKMKVILETLYQMTMLHLHLNKLQIHCLENILKK